MIVQVQKPVIKFTGTLKGCGSAGKPFWESWACQPRGCPAQKKTSGGKTCEALRCSVSTFNKFFLCQACRHNDQWSRALIPVLISEDIWGPCKSKRLRCKLLRADLLEHCRDLASWPQPCPRWVWLLPIASQRAYELRHCLGKRLVLRTDANSKNKHRSTIFVVDIGVIWRLSLSMSD